MKQLDEILLARALTFKHGPSMNAKFIDAAIESGEVKNVTKNVCAHLAIPLVDRLENALSVLDMTKREFIETAILDALDRYDAIMAEHGVWEAFEGKSGVSTLHVVKKGA